jgi:hypothetical protein
MALPVEPTEEQASSIRRAVVVFALWVAGRRRGRVLTAAAERLALDEGERAAMAAYEVAPERFSFFNRRGANWLFGQIVARIVGHPGDWAVAAPAAAWAIHAIKAADEAADGSTDGA